MAFMFQYDGIGPHIEFTVCNVICTGLLYVFEDSLLNQYIDSNMIYMNIIFHSVQLISVITYFMTSLLDPGRVKLPEMSQENENIDIEEQDIDNTKYVDILSRDPNSDCYEFMIIDNIPSYNKNIIIDREMDHWWPSNYCDECNFIRPIRSKHCRSCGICVSKFDHHCPLAANCVGINNYKYFVSFLFIESILLLWILYIVTNCVFDKINHSKTYYKHTLFGWICRVLFFIVIFILFFQIIGLFGFHLYLISSGQSTLEFMRPDTIDKYLYEEMKRKKKFENRYDHNVEEKKDDDAKDDDNDDNDDNVNDVNDDDDDNDNNDNGNIGYFRNGTRYKYKYKYYGDITSYPAYFDYGFIRNLMIFFNGYSHSEWLTPLKVKLRNPSIDYSQQQQPIYQP